MTDGIKIIGGSPQPVHKPPRIITPGNVRA